jgi:hypothetical protein
VLECLFGGSQPGNDRMEVVWFAHDPISGKKKIRPPLVSETIHSEVLGFAGRIPVPTTQ